MVRLVLTLEGSPKDDRQQSGYIEREEAERQLEQVTREMQQQQLGAVVQLPWGTFRASKIKSAQIREQSPGPFVA